MYPADFSEILSQQAFIQLCAHVIFWLHRHYESGSIFVFGKCLSQILALETAQEAVQDRPGMLRTFAVDRW